MKGLSPQIYDKDYYLNSNLGFEEFKKYKGKKVNKEISDFADLVGSVSGKKILDLGCGRGDLVFELARRGAMVAGVDYSEDGIKLAKDVLKTQSSDIKKRTSFFVRDAKKINFDRNSFDIIVSYDVFEHLYKDELEVAMKQISYVLKANGILIVHTETNKIYLNFTHKVWCYWMDLLLLNINRHIFKKDYPGLSKDPRNDLHKKQHVNEPTYFYLKSLFDRYEFEGDIRSIVPYKPSLSWKDKIYNVFVYLYPFSNFLPLNLFFATEYVCIEENKK